MIGYAPVQAGRGPELRLPAGFCFVDPNNGCLCLKVLFLMVLVMIEIGRPALLVGET